MALLEELEKIANLIRDRNSEFQKLDRIDGLLCLSVVMDQKTYKLTDALVDYLKEVYKERGVLIDSKELMKELTLWERHFKKINFQS